MGTGLKSRAKRTYGGLSSSIERRLAGIETSRVVKLDDLALASPERVNYVPSGWRALRRILPPGEISHQDVLIDLGSGKGRVLLEAQRYPFGRIIGVELSDTLTEVARANLERVGGGRMDPRVELVTADAAEYRVPDDVTVVYLYNPVRGEAFDRLLKNLLSSLERRRRRLRLIYRTPFEEPKLLAGGFTLVRSRRGPVPWSPGSATRLYEAPSR